MEISPRGLDVPVMEAVTAALCLSGFQSSAALEIYWLASKKRIIKSPCIRNKKKKRQLKDQQNMNKRVYSHGMVTYKLWFVLQRSWPDLSIEHSDPSRKNLIHTYSGLDIICACIEDKMFLCVM